MTSTGIWSLEDTPGILEVFTNVDIAHVDALGDDEGNCHLGSTLASPNNRAEVASKLLETLEDYNYEIEEQEAFPDWFPEKAIDLPQSLCFDDELQASNVSAASVSQAAPQHPAAAAANQFTHSGKLAYESSPDWSLDDSAYLSFYAPSPQVPAPAPVPAAWTQQLDPIDAAMTSQLTPPHSPSMYEVCSKQDGLVKGASHIKSEFYSTSELSDAKDDNIMSLLQTMNPKEINEIIMSNLEDTFVPDVKSKCPNSIADTDSNYMTSDSLLSPEHSSSSCDSSYEPSDYSSDPDYAPDSPAVVYNRKNMKSAERSVGSSSSASRTMKATRTSGSSVRAKPYSRKHGGPAPVEEKKMRKKEQNKNAATRYRQKKKQEIEEILGEEKELQDKNDTLTKKVDDLTREIKFMKKFMRDFFKTQGVLK